MDIDVKKLAQSVTRWVGSSQSIVVHTCVFAASFLAVYFHVLDLDRMLLVLTTLVSLEAIYLAIFIQMTLNEQARDIDEIQEDIDEIQEDVEDIQEDVEEMQEDVEEMSEEDAAEAAREQQEHKTLEEIRTGLERMMKEIEVIQKK
jgi:methyl-accepting chemotaxis protein